MNSGILLRIKEDLKNAMKDQVQIIKLGEQGGCGFSKGKYDKMIAQKEVSRSIISMFPEIGTKPDKATDEDTIRLLKKYISMEQTRELYQQRYLTEADVSGLNTKELNALVTSRIIELGDKLDSPKIVIAKGYLPKQATEEEIKAWIIENIDFSQFKNKMQAMKPIMNQFQGCDGNIVKKILMKDF